MPKQPDNPRGAPVYFGGWGSYRIPFVPQEPISQEEAERRTSYYVGYFDGEARLVQFEKYLNGRLEWKDEYLYWDNGKLKARRMERADGSLVDQDFDRKGRLIR